MLRLFFFLSLAVPAQAQTTTPPKVAEVVAPAATKAEEFTARVGQLKRFASTDPKAKWELAASSQGADLTADGKGGCIFCAERIGVYTLICYTDGPVQWVQITVGAAPTPTPTPTPTPPKPIEPPPPFDTVAEGIRKAFEQDSGKPYEKKQWAAVLAGVWMAGAEHAANPKVKTVKQLVEEIRNEVGTQLQPNQLAESRKAIGAELQKLLASPDNDLSPDRRKQAADLFNRFAKTLETLSQ
jgi:hypothetical protein